MSLSLEEFMSNNYTIADSVTLSAIEVQKLVNEKRYLLKTNKRLKSDIDGLSSGYNGLSLKCDALEEQIQNNDPVKLKEELDVIKQQLELANYYAEHYKNKYNALKLTAPMSVSLYA